MKRLSLIITATLFSIYGFAQLNPDFSPNREVSLCGPTDVFFVCTSPATPNNIWWDFGDGNTGSGINPVHRYTTTGLYTVKMIVEKNGVKDSITKTDFVMLNPKPVSSFVTDLTEVPKAYQRKLLFTGMSNADSISQYTWIINGNNVMGKNTVLYNFVQNGSYPVSLTVTNNKGCSDEFVDTVEIADEPDQPTALNDITSNGKFVVKVQLDYSTITIVRTEKLTESASVSIIDITGRVVYTTEMKQGEPTLTCNTDGLRPGAYIIELKAQSFVGARRFDKIML